MHKIEQNFRLIEFPDGAIVIQKQIQESWENDFTISPIPENICIICGHPLLKEQSCIYHSELKNIATKFSLCFGGYYQTDLNFNPINEYTKRIQRFYQQPDYIPIFLDILKCRWEKVPKKEIFTWLTLIPSQKSNMEILAQQFAKKFNLFYISWHNLFRYIPITSIKYQSNKKKRRKLIKEKYHLNIEKIKEYEQKLLHPGIILDDIFNTGMTMSYIISLLLKKIKLDKIKGLVLARTKGKTIEYLRFPKNK